MNSIGLAVIGSTGVIGKVHIDAIRTLDNCRLVGVNARRQEPLRAQAAELRVACYATLEAALDAREVDAVLIATPHPSHLEITTKAVAAGKHVLVEKPISVTPSEADAMIETARSAGVKLSVLFNNRFRSEAQKAKSLIEQGAIGEILRTSMTSVMFRSQDYYDRLDWRGSWEMEGGGVLINQGIHAIDMLQWLSGMPTSVFGAVRTLKHRIEVEDYASAVLEYPNGGQGTLHCTTALAPNMQRLEVWGERGALMLDNGTLTVHTLETPLQEFIDSDETEAFVPPRSGAETLAIEPVGTTHVPAIDDFVRAILEDREPAVSGESARDAQELVAAITLSGCRGTPVSLPVDRAEFDALMAELRAARKLPNA